MLLVSFIFISSLYFFRLPYLLLSLVLLEVLSFLLIFILVSFISSGFVVVLLFSVFVFLAIMGVVGFYTLLVSSGSDFVSSAVSVEWLQYGTSLISLQVFNTWGSFGCPVVVITNSCCLHVSFWSSSWFVFSALVVS